MPSISNCIIKVIDTKAIFSYNIIFKKSQVFIITLFIVWATLIIEICKISDLKEVINILILLLLFPLDKENSYFLKPNILILKSMKFISVLTIS